MTRKLKGVSRRFVISILLITAALCILLASTNSLKGVPERVGLAVLSFMQRGFDAVGTFVSSSINSIAELRSLQKSHDELLKKVETLGRLERNYTELRRENEQLLEQLGYMKEQNFSVISAKIIARDPENVYTSFVLNKGAVHGVTKNHAVVAYQNGAEGLVGRVIEVARNSCVVSPIYDTATYVAVKLERSRYDGLAMGSGSDETPLTIRYIKKRAKDEIQYGDLVVTSGMQSIYPAGIGIGRITKVKDYDYLTSLELEMESILDFGRIEYVFIIKNAQPQEN